MTSRQTFPMLAAGMLVAAVGIGWSIGTFRNGGAPPSNTPKTEGRAELLYQVNCASCHGAEGRGDGLVAATLRPPPRDFAARPWRFEFSKESIRRVIRDGIPGTTMPAARATLSAADVDLLVDHVHHLATSRPLVVHEPTVEETLLRNAGFVDLRGRETPSLTLTDAQGQIVKLADLKGRLVLISFWGTSCEPCMKELPHLRQLETDLADKPFTILHVCADAADAKEAQAALDSFKPVIRALADESGLGLARFEVQSLPTVWLIDASGKAIGRAHGAKDWKAPAMRGLVEHWLPQ